MTESIQYRVYSIVIRREPGGFNTFQASVRAEGQRRGHVIHDRPARVDAYHQALLWIDRQQDGGQ